MIKIGNDFISAIFSPKGAELQSLRHTRKNIEYIWSGNPSFWGKHSPVLFPIVGGLKDDTYYFEGKEYRLSRHGFARDREFSYEKLSETEVSFTLSHDEETLKNYPFEFTLNLRYRISGSTLTCTCSVHNPSERLMLFSFGNHPAFATPSTDGLSYADYYLQFNLDNQLIYHKISHDLIDDETVTKTLEDNSLPLSHELFYEDALVFKTLKSNCVSLKNTINPHGINYHFNDFPYFGIWAAKDADFVCLEAWCGIADGIGHNKELKDKEGIIKLAAGDSWQRNWSVECF